MASCTFNPNIDREYYIYRHTTLEDVIFYIGLGSKISHFNTYIQEYKRAFCRQSRSPSWKIAAKKGIKVDILVEGLSYQEACIKEKEFISIYGRVDLNTGTLLNKTSGGAGAVNCEGTKKAIQAAVFVNTLTQEKVIGSFKQKHGDRYDYSKVIYKGTDLKVIIKCSLHGEFLQTPCIHKRGGNCPKCMQEKITKSSVKANIKRAQVRFKEKVEILYEGKLDFSQFVYTDPFTKSKIICAKHGEFFQTPRTILRGNSCSKCKGEKSKERTRKAIRIKKEDGTCIEFPSIKDCADFLGMTWSYLSVKLSKNDTYIKSKKMSINYV